MVLKYQRRKSMVYPPNLEESMENKLSKAQHANTVQIIVYKY